MMDNVWKKFSEKRPKGKKLIRLVGIFSGLVWVAAIGAFFALKDKGLTKELAEAAGVKTDTLEIHGLKLDNGAAGREDAEAEAAPQGHAESARAGAAESKHAESSEAEAAAHEAPGEATEGEEHSAKATLNVDMPSREEAQALKELAELHAGAGELDKAVAPLERILTVPTRDADLLTLATKVFLGTGHYGEALQTAEQALALRSSDLGLKVQAIEATYRLGRVEKAFAEARQAVKEHPTDLPLLVQLGTMEVELGPGQPGYGKSLQAALKLKSDYAPAVYLLGRKAQLEGNYKDAEITFRRLMKIDPKRPKIHGQLGIALYHLGRLPEAEREFTAELAMNPYDYNTLFNLGELHLLNATSEKKPAKIQALRAEAMECYLKALDLNPKHAQAHYRVGVLLNGNGQYKEAIRHLSMALKLDSRHVPTLVQLAVAYENLKQPERAKEFITKAYELDPLNKVVLFKLKQWS